MRVLRASVLRRFSSFLWRLWIGQSARSLPPQQAKIACPGPPGGENVHRTASVPLYTNWRTAIKPFTTPREAAVHGNRGPVDERGLVAREVDQRVGDVCCAGEPSKRHFAESLRPALGVLEHGLHEGGFHRAGVDGVAADIVLRVSHGHRFREQGQGALGRRIGLVRVPVADQAADRGHVEDDPAAPGPHDRQGVLDPEKRPLTFTANMASKDSTGISSMFFRMLMPALLTRMSRRPVRSSTAESAAFQLSSEVTSSGRKTAPMDAAVFSPSARFTSHTNTEAPSSRNLRAVSAPSPPAAPVIRAVLPERRIALTSRPPCGP